jgi:tetratricopeptide (TPR) repeat protein
MSQLDLCLVTVILLAGSGIAADVPFVFEKNSSDLAGYDSNQLKKASNMSRDLAGVPPVFSPSYDDIIEVSLVTNDSINTSSCDNKTTESQRISSGLIALNQSSMAKMTNISLERFETNLQPVYSLMILPAVAPSSSGDWFNEGNMNYNNGNYQKAIECYDHAIKLNPQLKEAWCNKGISLCKLSKYQDAINIFDYVLSIYPDYSTAWRSKGQALKAMGREDEAKQAFLKASLTNGSKMEMH